MEINQASDNWMVVLLYSGRVIRIFQVFKIVFLLLFSSGFFFLIHNAPVCYASSGLYMKFRRRTFLIILILNYRQTILIIEQKVIAYDYAWTNDESCKETKYFGSF